MFRGLYVVLLFTLLLVSCGEKTGRATPAAPAEPVTQLAITDIMENAGDYLGSVVGVTGTVEHVCRHGGKKMFIVGATPEERLRVTAGDAVGAFEVTLEGSDVVVQGPVMEEKVDDAFLDAWEADLKETGEGNVPGQGAEAGDHHDDIPMQIATFRMIIADNDGEPLSFYHLACESFEELD